MNLFSVKGKTRAPIWLLPENDSIFLYAADAKYEYSIDLGDIILDVDNDNSIAGIEILDASLLFGLPKEDLKNTVKTQHLRTGGFARVVPSGFAGVHPNLVYKVESNYNFLRTRKPRSSSRLPGSFLRRFADRQ